MGRTEQTDWESKWIRKKDACCLAAPMLNRVRRKKGERRQLRQVNTEERRKE
jgi:hypothetical protein